MTLPRAIALLLVSILIAVAGVFLIFMRVQGGLVNSSNPSYSTGAFSGDAAATPQGAGSGSRGTADATVEALRREITAAAATRAALLTPFPTGATGRGSAVAIGEQITVGSSRFTVHQLVDPEPPGFFPTGAGNRRVAIEITQEALAGPLNYNFAQFRLRDANGTVHSWTTTNSSPGFMAGTLQAGETRRGWLTFQLPIGVAPDALIFQPLTSTTATVIVALR